jgi:hypothetical protein
MGDVAVIEERLGGAVAGVRFERGVMRTNTLSLHHSGRMLEETIGPLRVFVGSAPADAVARCRADLRALAAEYFDDNCVLQDHLMTTAIKRA